MPPPPPNLPDEFHSRRVDQVANPRLFHPPSYISDACRHLSPEQHRHLSLRLDALQREVGVEMAVVTVRSVALSTGAVGGVRGWVLRLFNHWGVGRAKENDGVMIVVVEESRRMEVMLGDGCKELYGLTDAVINRRVLDECMIPWFKRDEYGMGLVEGVSVLDQLIRQGQLDRLAAGTADTALATQLRPAVESGGGRGGGGGGGDRDGGSGGFTGWGGGASTFTSWLDSRIVQGLMATFAGFLLYRSLTASPHNDPYAPPTRCARCTGRVKMIGVVDHHNLSAITGFAGQRVDRSDSTPRSSEAFPAALPSEDEAGVHVVDSNIYQPDYRVDYQHALDSMSEQQTERLQQPGVHYKVFVCGDCSTLYLQQADADDHAAALPIRERTFSSYDNAPYMARTPGVAGGGRPVEVVWLPAVDRRSKAVRRESGFGGSSGSGGSGSAGFGGGSSSGGGAGASF